MSDTFLGEIALGMKLAAVVEPDPPPVEKREGGFTRV
jgi:hypothetical protein